MRLDDLLRSVAPPAGPLGIEPTWAESDLSAAFGTPTGRDRRRKSGFWTLRFEHQKLTIDASFIDDGELALVHIEGVTWAPLGDAVGWAVELTEEGTTRLSRAGIRLALERHGDAFALSWQL